MILDPKLFTAMQQIAALYDTSVCQSLELEDDGYLKAVVTDNHAVTGQEETWIIYLHTQTNIWFNHKVQPDDDIS